MKKIPVIKLILTKLLLLCCVGTANANAPFKKVAQCESDFFNGSFCSKKNLMLYGNVLKAQKANFNKKYILLNTGHSDSLELIALDTKTGMAYALNYQFTGWEDNQGKVLKKPSFQFSLNTPKVCLSGSQYDGEHPGTHETYSNIRQCFEIKTERNFTEFESDYSDRIQYEYHGKTKNWKPIS